jgi:hypothetical protein
MDTIEKIKKLDYVNRMIDTGESQYSTLHKITQLVANEVFEELCEEHSICYVCGKNLEPNVRLMIREPYPQVTWRKIFTKGCPDTSCEYNKRLVAKYEN